MSGFNALMGVSTDLSLNKPQVVQTPPSQTKLVREYQLILSAKHPNSKYPNRLSWIAPPRKIIRG
jgi:hypothetical protein